MNDKVLLANEDARSARKSLTNGSLDFRECVLGPRWKLSSKAPAAQGRIFASSPGPVFIF